MIGRRVFGIPAPGEKICLTGVALGETVHRCRAFADRPGLRRIFLPAIIMAETSYRLVHCGQEMNWRRHIISISKPSRTGRVGSEKILQGGRQVLLVVLWLS